MPLTQPATLQTGLSGLNAVVGRVGAAAASDTSRGGPAPAAQTRDQRAETAPVAAICAHRHRAVVPRCWKKFTSPGAAPTTSAAAPETSAAIRPRAA